MADPEFKDMTGEPRSDAELQEAVERHLVRSMNKLIDGSARFVHGAHDDSRCVARAARDSR
jgi:hypothetical protein